LIRCTQSIPTDEIVFDRQFVTFADPNAAASFYQQATGHGLMIHNTKVKISWGRSVSNLSPAVMANITSGATRNVYIGSVDDFEKFNEAKLRQDFGEFGGMFSDPVVSRAVMLTTSATQHRDRADQLPAP
jgi:hypothetical protein